MRSNHGNAPAKWIAAAAAVLLLAGLSPAAAQVRPTRPERQAPKAAQTRALPALDAGRIGEAVLGVARWLDEAGLKTPAGKTWPADPRDPKTVNPTLYSGTPGVVLFYLEAAAAGFSAGPGGGTAASRGRVTRPRIARRGAEARDAVLLNQARAGADELLLRLGDDLGAGFYEGLAGIGYVLRETFKATGEVRYKRGFERCLEMIRAKAVRKGRGFEWSPVTDVIGGAAGTGLFLLYAFDETGEKAWLDLAIGAGGRLIELAKTKDRGLDWAMDPSFPRTMPNFSHGTAGVAFFLARLYERTQRREFLTAALAGARYLLSIAKTDDDSCLIYHDEPDGKDLYYLGWCHGPVGTANLFYELFKTTGDRTWMEWVLREARGLVKSGLPEKETPGFWNNAGICCGLAGVADFFLNLHVVTGDRNHLAFGRRVLTELRRRATADGGGLRWIQAEHRTHPELLVAQTGLMQGAAGIGLVLLRWNALESGRPVLIRMPDSAFR